MSLLPPRKQRNPRVRKYVVVRDDDAAMARDAPLARRTLPTIPRGVIARQVLGARWIRPQ